jgi:WD40 repeat protein
MGEPLTQPDQALQQAVFSRDGGAILTGWSGGDRVLLWRAPPGEGGSWNEKRGLGSDWERQQVIALVPGSACFLTMGWDGFGTPQGSRLWELSSGKPLGAPLPFPVYRGSAAFDVTGRYLALGGDDQYARLWSPGAGVSIGPPLLHPGPVYGVAFHPEAHLLATAGMDSAVRIWKIHKPLEGTPSAVQELVEVLTGTTLEATGSVQTLSAAGIEERRQRLTVNWPE